MKKVLYYLIQWTWGLPQNLAGLFVFLCQNAGLRGEPYKYSRVVNWKRKDSLSLGMFLFIGKSNGLRIIKHEYGHSIQSLITGPFYLIVIGVPSFLWFNIPCLAKQWKSGKVSYFSRFPENWADRLGHVTKDEKKCIVQKLKTT